MATTQRPLSPRWGPVRRLAGAVVALGGITEFTAVALAGAPRALRYVREIWWFCALVAVGSTGVAVVLTLSTGAECSVEAYYSLSQIGAQSLAGVFNAICDTREISPLFFGFAIGAKVGCGLVAELGTMRINEEVDALDVMGVPSRIYLVSTRLVACLIVLPLMYVFSLIASYVSSYLVQRYQVPSNISSGVYFDYFFHFINPEDLLFSMIKAVAFSFLIVAVALYYGWNVTGGAVGIGRACAKTMAVSLVLTVVVNALLTQLFWGTNPNLPIQT